MSKILARLFSKSKRQPRRQPTLFEALDMSLQFGYSRVNWQAVNWGTL